MLRRLILPLVIGLAIALAWFGPPFAVRAFAAETGLASWYGPGFHGRKTASGERYDQNGISCAHKRHRMGTLLRVTRLATGRSILCRINDRGPYVRGRIVDLSRGAAARLGIVSSGVARVRVEVVR